MTAAPSSRRPTHTKGRRFPADPPRVEEIIAVMRQAGEGLQGARARALIAILWRAGLRIQEALDLSEGDLDADRGSLLVRHGKGGRRRESGMDDWGWAHVQSWIDLRVALPVGQLFCTVQAPSHGRPWTASALGPSCGAWPLKPASAGASRPINFATPTRSNSPEKECQSTSSSASSATPTSASPPSTCRGSTPQRSSAPSTPAAHQ